MVRSCWSVVPSFRSVAAANTLENRSMLGLVLLNVALLSGLSAERVVSASCGLSLGPANVPSDQAFWRQDTQSWGGSVYVDLDGRSNEKYHMFVSAFAKACGVPQWTTNSYVAHAVSNHPQGPFKPDPKPVLPIFHHNPEIHRHPDGTYLLFSIGGDNSTGEVDCTVPGERPGRTNGRSMTINLHHATSLDGPWSSAGVILADTGSLVPVHGSNPSVYIMPNGTVVVSFKIGLKFAVAEHWKGPYKVLNSGQSVEPYQPPGVHHEDQFLWFDNHKQRWNTLWHVYSPLSDAPNGTWKNGTGREDPGVPPGGFAYSATADLLSNWTFVAAHRGVYNFSAVRTDGKMQIFERRERPKLLFDSSGKPTMLFNGVVSTRGGKAGGDLMDHGAHTYAQPVVAWVPPYLDGPCGGAVRAGEGWSVVEHSMLTRRSG